MQKIYDRDMTVDYTTRCVIEADGYDVVRYGTNAAETNNGDGGHWWRDLAAPYAALSRGGRRPGQPERVRQHFFNKRVMLDDEKYAGRPVLRGADHRDAQQAQDPRGGVGGAGQVAFPSTVAGSGAGGAAVGCGDPGCADPNCTYGTEEA